MGQSAESVVQSVWQAFEAGGHENWLPLCADDLRLRPFGASEPLEGRETVRRYLDELAAAGGTLRARAVSFETVGDDRVVIHGRLRRESPGRISDDDVWWTCTLRDGRIAEVEASASRPG